jgi:hypothetical protein
MSMMMAPFAREVLVPTISSVLCSRYRGPEVTSSYPQRPVAEASGW